ncbi:DUF2946 family protein [Polaromonas sp.]|uniref:DUF2946 family protein n=1 Tax=Polaromonas sp. TaxID=1869339 RepID=UPI002869FBE5|nr:DUF2946 family protein [Polaromonas sp.]
MTCHRPSAARLPLTVWARLAAWLGFLAVLSALAAPVSMLAEEVRTGQLGGLCSAGKALAAKADAGEGAALQAGGHCDWCGSMGQALPPLPLAAVFCASADSRLALQAFAPRAAFDTGRPFSRGPPAL